MKRLVLLFCLCMLVFAGVGALAQDEPTTMDLATALAFWSNDSIAIEYSDAGQVQLEEIIAALKTGLGVPADLDETNEDAVGDFAIDISLKDVVNKLSQAYYTLANVFIDPSENEDIYLKGKNWGLKSLRMDPGFAELENSRFDSAVAAEADVAALYWANSNWLRVAQKHPMQAVLAGVTKRVQAIMNRLLELDTSYLAGGIYRSYGAYYSGLPIGKDMNKALAFLCHVVDQADYCSACDIEQQVEGADEYFENRTFFVEFYLMPKKQWEDAAQILQSVIDAPIGDKYPFMNAYSKEHAQELLAEVQGHL